jgi:phosphoribosylaminoimidazolecarboxamide formyltransferase / IMP cyclohydrolase
VTEVVPPVRRALVSCFDKTGVAELARSLHELGVELVSTGSTAATLREAGVPVVAVADVTGFPECLDGRVKTLHPGCTPASSPTATTPPTWPSSRSSASTPSTSWW